MNLVVVEGGQKAIKNYKKMMQKVNWNRPLEEKDDEKLSTEKASIPKVEEKVSSTSSSEPKDPTPKHSNKCTLIWEVSLIKLFKFLKFS